MFLASKFLLFVWFYFVPPAAKGGDDFLVTKATIRDFVLKGAKYGAFDADEIRDWLSNI